MIKRKKRVEKAERKKRGEAVSSDGSSDEDDVFIPDANEAITKNQKLNKKLI